MEIREIFENYIKIEPKVMSIESLFNNEERVNNTNYKPSYQRNYVWDIEKATYFIESILLGTEIPPLIYFRNGDRVEVIDGRQRYETILRFKDDDFKLKKSGLQKLENVGFANKYFKNLDSKSRDLFWDTKLRIIEFSFHTRHAVTEEMEEVVKKEIFKRYNSGITPLKPTDIDKAAYIDDDLNSFFKKKILSDSVLHSEIASLLHFERSNIELIMKKIRQLLVLHKIPIKYYSVKKDSVISKYFDFLSSTIEDSQIQQEFDSFIEKVNILKQLQQKFLRLKFNSNRLVFECVFWGLSILEIESENSKKLSPSQLQLLTDYIVFNKEIFKMERSSFSKELHERYLVTSQFFSENFGIDFTAYLQNNPDFKAQNQLVGSNAEGITSFDDLRINKPEPSSTAIDDICRQMERQRFLIRPAYQRDEVINRKKSSAIIESILMGIKLPPIFIFKRKDDISEVLDGQQRLLSILGFIGKPYRDENNEIRYSAKNNFQLNLKNGILKNLNGKNFTQLSKEERDKIKNFDLWLIEISEKNNEHFESIDLFIRLNNKPYPIKEDTFEMWNSYISRDVIDTIKSIHRNNKDWFYLRKNNSRMEDENIYTSLIYLEFQVLKNGFSEETIAKHLDIYKIGDKINFRVKSKVEISKILENNDFKNQFLIACLNFEFEFLRKLRVLLSDDENANYSQINKNLDNIFNKENNRRTQQSFYSLWYLLHPFTIKEVEINKVSLRNALTELFNGMDHAEAKSTFEKDVNKFWSKFKSTAKKSFDSFLESIDHTAPVPLGAVCSIITSNSQNSFERYSASKSTMGYEFVKDFSTRGFQIFPDKTGKVSIDDMDNFFKEIADSKNKIVIKRITSSNELSIGIYEEKAVFGTGIIVLNMIGFSYLPKFIVALLSSSLLRYWIAINSSSLSGNYRISSSTLKAVPLPIINKDKQILFLRVVDYINLSDENLNQIDFFKRLIDLMVYEIYFEEQMINAGCDVMKYLQNIPEFQEGTSNSIQEIGSIYLTLSSKENPISIAMFKLANVDAVIQIEGKI